MLMRWLSDSNNTIGMIVILATAFFFRFSSYLLSLVNSLHITHAYTRFIDQCLCDTAQCRRCW